MAVTFGTAVVHGGTSTSKSWAMSGVNSGQPIVLALLVTGSPPATPSISDTFSTQYTWSRVLTRSLSSTAKVALYLGTGGAGTSGTITATCASGTVGGAAVAAIGASTAPGIAAVDRSGSQLSVGPTVSLSLSPSAAGDGAVYFWSDQPPQVGISSSPPSPWVNSSSFTNSSSDISQLSTYSNPTATTALTGTWTGVDPTTGPVIVGLLLKSASAPTPPTGVTAIAGSGSALVSWRTPSNYGGSPITGYQVRSSPGTVTKTWTASSLSTNVTGLVNGVAYTFTVTATSAAGTSSASLPSSPVTPGTVPGSPTLVATAGNSKVSLSWVVPSTDGGAAITGYNVYKGTTSGGESTTPVNAAPITGTAYSVIGLTDTDTYYFTVKALNVWGASAASNEVATAPEPPITSVLTPLLVATPTADPLSGDPAITLTVTNTQPKVGPWPNPTAMILRSDGTYVLGASPTDPITLSPSVHPTTLYATSVRTGTAATLGVATSVATATHRARTVLPGTAGGAKWVRLGLGATDITGISATEPSPDGKGAVFTTTPTGRLLAGLWTVTLRMKCSGTYTVTSLRARVWRKKGSVYTQIGSDLNGGSLVVTPTFQTFTITGTLPSVTFGAGTELYVDVVAQGSSTGTILYLSVGTTYLKIVSPWFATTDAVASIVDRSAPYGVASSYVAFITYGGTTSPPSLLATATMGQAPATVDLYNRLGWAKDEDTTGVLLQWLSGIGEMIQAIDDLCRDGYDTEGNPAPGWSQVLDVDRCPTEALPWLAQFLGIRFPGTLRDDQKRYLIKNAPGFARGTVTALIAAINPYLLPGFTATVIERDTSPYHLAINVPTNGTIGPSSCLSLWVEYSTCTALLATFPTCQDVWLTDAQIAKAVEDALPAGLMAQINYL